MYRSHEIAVRLFVRCLALFVFAFVASAQQKPDDFPVELPTEESVLTRSIGGDIIGGSEAFRFKKPSFRLKRVVRKSTPKKSVASSASKPPQYILPANDTSSAVWEKVGITLWKATEMKTVVPEKETARLLTQENGERKELVPIRVGSDTVFNRGDKVRISIEAPRKGYLYIIDREILENDSLGPPYQIFPTMLAHNGNNAVQAGVITDIPTQSDRSPFFTMGSTTPGYRGEMLTIILSPIPLKEFGTPGEPSLISQNLADEMEQKYTTDVGEYEQQGTDGKPYTNAEKAAGATPTRQLTQSDPYPQTVYRVKVGSKTPILLNVRLSVR